MARKLSWEKKFENLLSQEPISEKIEAVKLEIETLKASKVEGNFKSKEEYQEALKEHKKEIRKEVRKKERQIKEYNNFRDNKDKITNILIYRKELEKRLKELTKSAKTTYKDKEIQAKEAEKRARKQRMAQFEREIAKIEEKLKGNLTDEEKQNYQIELQAKLLINNRLKEKQDKLVEEIKSLKKVPKEIDEAIENKKILYERRISKCNIIASNLLKGKDLGEFIPQTEQKGKKLTSKDDKLKKQIEATREAAREVATERGLREGNSLVNNYKELLENKKGKKQPSKNTKKQVQKEKNELIEINNFERKNPKLAKALNFFKKIKDIFKKNKSSKLQKKEKNKLENKPENKIEDKSEDNTNNKAEQNKTKKLTSKKDKDREQNENKLLLDITEKGIEKAFRDRMKVNTIEAANRYARKFGGRYEEQDGATDKKKRNNKNNGSNVKSTRNNNGENEEKEIVD